MRGGYFRNEIIWRRTSSHNDASVGFGSVTDSIFFYSKGKNPIWNRLRIPLSTAHVSAKYASVGEGGRQFTTRDLRSPHPRPNLTYDYKGYKPHQNGWSISRELMEKYDREGRLYFPKDTGGRIRLKIYLDESKGMPLQNLWDDIAPINSQAQERLGYPTQKPVALLERILNASSNEGDVVLDPFCGCGTTVHAAQKLNRQWIGIDVTHLAISLIQKRLRDAFPLVQIDVQGVPKDLDGARALAAQDKYQFQWWAVSLVDAVPFGNKKKGADGGIDGLIYFKPDGKTTEKAIVSVKGGENVGVGMVKDLIATVDREKAKMGLLISLAEPTKVMRTEAVSSGYYRTEAQGDFAKIQIITIEELLNGKKPQMPWVAPDVFKKAKREMKGEQQKLL